METLDCLWHKDVHTGSAVSTSTMDTSHDTISDTCKSGATSWPSTSSSWLPEVNRRRSSFETALDVESGLTAFEGYLFDVPNSSSTPVDSGPVYGDHNHLEFQHSELNYSDPTAAPQTSGRQRAPVAKFSGRGDSRRAQGYRSLWQQVTKVKRGQKLEGAGGFQSTETTVEDLVNLISSLPPQASAIDAISTGLHTLDSSALAALLKELSKQGQIKRAVEIFDWLRSLNEEHELHKLLDVYTYTTMIAQCQSHQQLRRALELVAEMRSKGVPCNVHTYSALMNVCIKANELELALDVYKQMLDEGCQPNLVTYNTLIDVYIKIGLLEEAVKVLDILDTQGIQPEVRTYNTIISAFSKLGRAEDALRLYQRLLAANIQPSATTYTALISAFGKKGQVGKAIELFDDMLEKGCERNVITYSSLISACERAGRWELALDLFNRMHRENCKPNVVTYNSLIAACATGGHWEKAGELFEQMKAQRCQPDGITYSALITAFERGGQWRHALRAFEQMHSAGCHPDSALFNALMEALWQSGVQMAQMRAMQLWPLANRHGHFRVFMQARQGDMHMLHYSCVAFTTGAAMVVLLRWLADIKSRMSKEGQAFLRQQLRFTFVKNKHSRVEQPSSVICETISSTLAAAASPFQVSLQEGNIVLDTLSSALAHWMMGPGFADLTHLVAASQVRSLQSEALLLEDVAVEARCTEAFAAVRRFEEGHAWGGAMSGLAAMLPRPQLVTLLLKYQMAFGFSPDTAYDALQLMDRALPMAAAAAGQLATLAPLILASAILLAAHQAEPPNNVPSIETAAMVTGFPAETLHAMQRNLLSWLHDHSSAVSALRTGHLLLERLGTFMVDAKHAARVSKALQVLMARVAGSSLLLEMQPSTVAAAMVAVIRRSCGLLPVWPLALAAMTGITNMGTGEVGAAVSSVSALAQGLPL